MNTNWINEHSNTPKYLQIVNAVKSCLEQNTLKKGDALPSVNKLLQHYDISRDTVVRAYELLKNQGIIEAIHGKGFYISNDSYVPKARIFLLFNKLSPHKKIIYDSFSQTLGEDIPIDFFIYHNDYNLFKKILSAHAHKSYSHYVIIAHFNEGGSNVMELLQEIPHEKIIILDKKLPGQFNQFSCIYQDFQNDINNALSQLLTKIRKYKKIKILFPEGSYHPKEILIGFKLFCQKYNIPYEIITEIRLNEVTKGDVYITLMEDDLVTVIKAIKSFDFKVGRDVGIISYNETPLKEVLLDGITVISTDFEELGRQCASVILEKKRIQIVNGFRVIERNSL